jgi:hypothetical protein
MQHTDIESEPAQNHWNMAPEFPCAVPKGTMHSTRRYRVGMRASKAVFELAKPTTLEVSRMSQNQNQNPDQRQGQQQQGNQPGQKPGQQQQGGGQKPGQQQQGQDKPGQGGQHSQPGQGR